MQEEISGNTYAFNFCLHFETSEHTIIKSIDTSDLNVQKMFTNRYKYMVYKYELLLVFGLFKIYKDGQRNLPQDRRKAFS